MIEELRAAHPDGLTRMWGAKPGERAQQVAKWGRLRAGDYIAFAANGRLFAGAVITAVFRSARLAQELWGVTTTANGATQTWELMFALSEIESIDVTYVVMNALIGRAARANVQEFAVLSQHSSDALLDHINRLESSFELPDPDFRPPVIITADLDRTDREVTSLRRMEQQALKSALLAGPNAACELCGRAISSEFLSAAHIKRRSLCSDEERLMLTAVAMLNCRFGCDELFGKGYVAVDETGRLQVSDLLTDPVVREYALQWLAGRTAAAWEAREETRPFFAFHWAHDFRRPVRLSH